MMTYEPRFCYTDSMVRDLMTIEGARQLIEVLPLPPDAAFLLRYEAQRQSTRYSTAIEGNTLSLEEIREALSHSDRTGSRQQQEVRNYWNALEWLERRLPDPLVQRLIPETQHPTEYELREPGRVLISEPFICMLHSMIIPRGRGRRPRMSSYRSSECPVVDRATATIEYGPPAPEDVPELMEALCGWRISLLTQLLPVPIRAGILAYQLVTIHPFDDGNGRTARALATADLWLGGYRMRGFLSVEEEYFRDLKLYYDNLQMGLPMNYYEGRNDPDLTPWLEYFTHTLALAANRLGSRALSLHKAQQAEDTPWEHLSRRQQQLLVRLAHSADETGARPFSPAEVADWFMVSATTARTWLREWHEEGFIRPCAGAVRVRSWELAESYGSLLKALLAQPQAPE
ncbi:Fic family protein [bacterium]|nr:Fic family protein [bacterium]